MSMITELIEKLRNLADEYAIADTDTMDILNDAAYAIEELSAKLQAANMERSSQYYNGGWIPVSELPKENGYYLWCSRGGEIKKDYYCDGHWISAEEYGYKVIAWMPLPEPPEEMEG